MIGKYVGTKDSLSSERTYALYTLPQGVFQGIKDTFFHRDITGLMRAGAIIAGFIITVAGYLTGSVTPYFSAKVSIRYKLKQYNVPIRKELVRKEN
jgi:hypothetical protein